MKLLGEVANIVSWLVVIMLCGAAAYLYWEDHQDVMSSIQIREGTTPVIKQDSIVLHLVGYKKLDKCSKVPFSDMGYAVIDGYTTEARFRYVDDDTPTSTFDGGLIDIGLSEFSKEGIENADYVGLKFKHNCHGVIKISPTYWMQVKQ